MVSRELYFIFFILSSKQENQRITVFYRSFKGDVFHSDFQTWLGVDSIWRVLCLIQILRFCSASSDSLSLGQTLKVVLFLKLYMILIDSQVHQIQPTFELQSRPSLLEEITTIKSKRSSDLLENITCFLNPFTFLSGF